MACCHADLSCRSPLFHELLLQLGERHDAEVAELRAGFRLGSADAVAQEVGVEEESAHGALPSGAVDGHTLKARLDGSLSGSWSGRSEQSGAEPGATELALAEDPVPEKGSVLIRASLHKQMQEVDSQGSGDTVVFESAAPQDEADPEENDQDATLFLLLPEWEDNPDLDATLDVSDMRKGRLQNWAGTIPLAAVGSKTSLGGGLDYSGGRRCFARPCHPRSSARVTWDIVGALLLLTDLVWLPLQAFDVQQYEIMSMPPMLFWTFDILVSFTTCFYNQDGELEREYSTIARHYARTWLVPDILLVSSDWVASALLRHDGDGRLVVMARTLRHVRNFRFLRLLRVVKIRGFLVWCFRTISSESISLVLEMVLSAATIVMVNHLIACLWFQVGSRQGSWVEKEDLEAQTLLTQYIYSLHWSLAQFTPASMEVFPENTLERVFCVMVIIFATFTFSSFLSTITSGMTQLRVLNSEKAKQEFILRTFISDNKISQDLSERITRHITMTTKINLKRLPMEKVRALNSLPSSLLLSLKKEIFSPWLGRHEFFSEYLTRDQEAVGELFCEAFKQEAFAEQDKLFKARGVAAHMYFVVRGMIEYELPRAGGVKRRLTLDPGSWLCEATLWMPWVHRGSATMLMDSELALLCARKFSQVTVKFPNTYALARNRAQTFLQSLLTARTIHDAKIEASPDECEPLGSDRSTISRLSHMFSTV